MIGEKQKFVRHASITVPVIPDSHLSTTGAKRALAEGDIATLLPPVYSAGPGGADFSKSGRRSQAKHIAESDSQPQEVFASLTAF
ncbi:hypothetical protein ABK905_03975 [Acerihabitans sp. KWT182]|uniref:Uncharacterized protein n=1 Tax=Acerihabitans sp. KWT182 TaxID=3157919 RepID=A0AAU7QBX7_9GAMM